MRVCDLGRPALQFGERASLLLDGLFQLGRLTKPKLFEFCMRRLPADKVCAALWLFARICVRCADVRGARAPA